MFRHEVSSGTQRTVLICPDGTAAISACVGPPANTGTLEDPQGTRTTNANLLLPVHLLILRTSTATTCPQIPTEWRFCSPQGAAWDFSTFSADPRPRPQPPACLSLPSPNTDLWDQLLSLREESSEKAQLPR